MKNVVLIRYGEIGTKSNAVRKRMAQTLRQRVQERLEYEGLEYEKVSKTQGRIIAYVDEAEKAADLLKNMPGIKTLSPAKKTKTDIDSIKKASEGFSYGGTFGIDPNTGETELSTPQIAEEIGAHVQEFTGSEVDLDQPETWLGIDVRKKQAYLFTEKLQGPGGFPTGTQGNYLALISGGIDSPLAAYEMMTRGADIQPIYFYNKPVSAEDHLMRFKAAAKKLEKFNPEKKWKAHLVDMEEVNEELMDVQRGRMVLHREIMFRVAEKIAEDKDMEGLVTGESMGQKSSQTPQNLEHTTSAINKPVLRPLLTRDKNSISQKAREIGTFEEAEINSACRTLSPENPATDLDEKRLQNLREEVDVEELAEKAYRSTKQIDL